MPEITFSKYHGLGNSYIVMDGREAVHKGDEADMRQLARIMCDPNYGIGSDGLLVDATHSDAQGALTLRIFNPDGSEAEKSGSGIRIFARWLWDAGRAGNEPFDVHTLGGDVRCEVLEHGALVRVQMGRVRVGALREDLVVDGRVVACTAANIGNPHCVVVSSAISKSETCAVGPLIETHARFPQRTNVQFVKVLDRASIAMEIWERGAGYTLSSGSSSCAAAAVCRALGLCGADIAVHTQGGVLRVALSAELDATLTGAVVKIARGQYEWPGMDSMYLSAA